MADQEMRLRLVVRRNGLPELRLMWHVQPDSNPTVSKLLEQLNEQVPLEGDHWGLEDYVVELHDNDGTDFECLHYQLVRSVLKPDDRVFIRALERDDHFRRRISGRHQISTDGRHLIDGIPFGQPRLRTATTRPNIYIPPLKRARLTYNTLNDEFSGPTAADDEAPLLLTNGEPREDLDDTESDADDADFILDDAESSKSTDVSSSGDEDEEDEEEDTSDEEDEDQVKDTEHVLSQGVTQEAREPDEEHGPSQSLALSTLDRLTTLRMVFPKAPIDLCEQVLGASGEDLGTAYKALSEAFSPLMSQEAAIKWRPGNAIPCTQGDVDKAPKQHGVSPAPAGAQGASSKKRKFREDSPVDDAEDDEYENDNSLWRKYDHAGFPPGTITSGKGLAHMAAVSATFDNGVANGNSETTSTTLKALTDEPIDQGDEDDTSSSGDSSSGTSSDGSDASSEDASHDGHSSAESSAADPDAMDSDSDLDSSSNSNDSESDSDSDSGPEQHSSKFTSRLSPTPLDQDSDNSSDSSDTSSDDSSDSSDDSSSSSDESSDNESTDDSSSESDEGNNSSSARLSKAATKVKDTPTVSQPFRSSPKRVQSAPAPIPVPPGAGKESTKRRNARRRAAKVAKRSMQTAAGENIASVTDEKRDGVNTALSTEAALFEAKRKALLEALASGGIEVGASGETQIDLGSNMKQKQTGDVETDLQHDKNKEAIEVNDQSPNDHQAESTQKRRRIDLGAGRRLVLGALGVRNPKNKDEEDKLRDRLRAEAQQEASRHVSSRPQPTTDAAVSMNDEEEPDAWKLKINYRAVECCQDNIELTPAPFPFRLRWDPQQQYPQGSKKGKRGGQSKRAQRNQEQYYESSHSDKKRKLHDSSEFVDSQYTEPYGTENGTSSGFDVMLNYDDVASEPRVQESDAVNATSQITDLDDLPSLPKDASTLPSLRPGEAKVGMVIAWLKWTCSPATSWQPQLSRITAIVANVDDDAATLNVCLAKRDRYLDSSEKRYDHTTGQRIYDRFEAPDLHEDGEEHDDNDEDGVDEGYRDISWADMKDPRILQQPLAPPNEPELMCNQDQIAPSAKVQDEAPQSPHISSHRDTDAVEDSIELASSIPDQIDEANLHVNVVPDSNDLLSNERQIDDSLEPSMEAASNSTSHHDDDSQQAADSMSDISQISSPSRQLHETTSQAMSSNSPPRSWIPASSVELGETPPTDTASFIPLLAPTSSQSHPDEEFESELVAETVRSAIPQTTIPSSADSIHSGRQPDYVMDIDNHGSDLFIATDDVDPQSDPQEQPTPVPERSSLTPIATRPTLTLISTNNIGEDEINKSSPLVSPSSGSLSSLSPLWCTAPTSRNTQSSSKAQDSPLVTQSGKPGISRDLKYEDAMRKLDEQVDDDPFSSPMSASSSIEVKKENLSQFHKKTALDEAISPPPRRRQPFTIPPGSQVVELSSDSEPAYSEHYADDEVDETYTPKSESLPKGDGWVKKNRDAEHAERRKTRKWAF